MKYPLTAWDELNAGRCIHGTLSRESYDGRAEIINVVEMSEVLPVKNEALGLQKAHLEIAIRLPQHEHLRCVVKNRNVVKDRPSPSSAPRRRMTEKVGGKKKRREMPKL